MPQKDDVGGQGKGLRECFNLAMSWWSEFFAIVIGDLVAALILFFFIENKIERRSDRRRSTETRATLRAIALRHKEWADYCINQVKDASRLPKHPARDYGLDSLIANYQNWGFEKGQPIKAKSHELFSELEKWEEYRNNGGQPDRIAIDVQMGMLRNVVKFSNELETLCKGGVGIE